MSLALLLPWILEGVDTVIPLQEEGDMYLVVAAPLFDLIIYHQLVLTLSLVKI